MKRIASSFFGFASVPAGILFVLTAGPARLYAETAPPAPACTAPDIQACTGKANGNACAFEGGSGVCQSALCIDRDAATFWITVLQCGQPPTTPEGGSPAEASANADPDAGVADDGPIPDFDANMATNQHGEGGFDAGAQPTADAGLDSGAPGGETGAAPGSHGGGGGCSTASGSTTGSLGFAAGLLLVVGTLFGLRRRASRT